MIKTPIACLLVITCLTACNPWVKKHKFPAAPETLFTECPALAETPPTEKLSVVLDVVVQNYGEYHKCRSRNAAWIEWYNNQQQIHDDVYDK